MIEFIVNPFAALLFIVGGVFLLYIVYRVRLNLTLAGKFNNESYQLGMVFAVVCSTLVLGMLGVFLWLLG